MLLDGAAAVPTAAPPRCPCCYCRCVNESNTVACVRFAASIPSATQCCTTRRDISLRHAISFQSVVLRVCFASTEDAILPAELAVNDEINI